jgi:hypothetical protein
MNLFEKEKVSTASNEGKSKTFFTKRADAREKAAKRRALPVTCSPPLKWASFRAKTAPFYSILPQNEGELFRPGQRGPEGRRNAAQRKEQALSQGRGLICGGLTAFLRGEDDARGAR